jgi:hypothetical protein
VETKKGLIIGAVGIAALLFAGKAYSSKEVPQTETPLPTPAPEPTPAPTPHKTKPTTTHSTTAVKPSLVIVNLFDRVDGLVKTAGSLIKDTVRIYVRQGIRNDSPFDVELNNVTCVLENSVDQSTWNVVAHQYGKASAIVIGKGKKVEGKVPVDFKLLDIQSVTSNKKAAYRVTVTYYYKGVKYSQRSIIELQNAINELSSSLKSMFTVGAVEAPATNTNMML